MKGSACSALLALGLFASDVAGGELLSGALQLSGSVRQVAVGTRGTDAERFAEAIESTLPSPVCVTAAHFADCPAFRVVGETDVWQTLTRVRTRLDLTAGKGLSANLVYDHEVLLGVLDTLEGNLREGFAKDPFVSLEDEIVSFDLGASAEGSWRHLLYRASARYETDDFEFIVGRQRIPWGVGRLWNPIDRFNPIGPLAIEGDQSPGVDAVNVKWLLSGFTFFEAAYAPQARRQDASYALRFHGILRDVDYSLVAGVFDEAWTAGFDLAGNLGGAAARVEAVYSHPEREVWPVEEAAPGKLAPFWQVVMSIDTNLDIGSGVYVLVEHLYNGNGLGFGYGEAGPLVSFFEATTAPPTGLPPGLGELFEGPFIRPTSRDRFGGSGVVSFSDHLTGGRIAYDPFVTLRAEVLAIYDWQGASAAFVPVLVYTPLGSLELTVGGQVFAGPTHSEFGPAENLAFLIGEWFF